MEYREAARIMDSLVEKGYVSEYILKSD
ncbi:hypothetical protein [Bacillus sp. JJ722]